MKFRKVIESLYIKVIDAGFSIPANENREVMYVQFIVDEEVDRHYSVRTVPHDSATILERVVESIFASGEDLNGDIIIEDHHYIVRLLPDDDYKDLNDPRIYVPTKRLSIIDEGDKNVICSELDQSITALDERLSKDTLAMVYIIKQ